MIKHFHEHLISESSTIRDALPALDRLASNAILFVVSANGKLIGSLTDGDIRRGLMRNLSLDAGILDFVQTNPKYILKGDYDLGYIIELRSQNINILPVVDKTNKVVNVINLRHLKSYLPVDALVMAGGRGARLKPLTDQIPKPLLPVGEKPIIAHNIDRLAAYGIDDFWISVRYLAGQIEDYLGDGKEKNLRVKYIHEKEPLGTIGAITLINEWQHDYILLTNSDILTNMDYENFFLDFQKRGADLSVVSVPYKVDVPYAVLETKSGKIQSFKEKPTYTYYANAGIYLMKKDVISEIPTGTFYNATDFMESLINMGKEVITYPMTGYWLDIGSPEDYKKAQDDINYIRF